MKNKLRHNIFVEFCKEHSHTHLIPTPVKRAVSLNPLGDGVQDIEYEELKVFSKAFALYPEALAYLFKLDGCTKRLFLFLLVFHVDRATGQFIFNISIIKQFTAFCKLFDESYKEETVKQSMKDLREMNVVLSLRRGLNMVNPMITGGTNETNRLNLIREYGLQLMLKKEDVVNAFYPRYD